MEAKDYSHLLGKLTGISDEQLKAHFGLYEGYVKKLNEIEEKLAKQDKSATNYSFGEFSELKRKTTDRITTSTGGQGYYQLGYDYQDGTFFFPLATKTEKNNFYNWYLTNDRSNPVIFIQFDDNLIDYPPLYGYITEQKNTNRIIGNEYFPFEITFMETF